MDPFIIIPTLLFMLFGVGYDVARREVPDYIWMVFLTYILVYLGLKGFILGCLVSLSIATLLGYFFNLLMMKTHYFYIGSGDLKFLVAISAAFPLDPLCSIHIITNASLTSLTVPIFLALKNALKGNFSKYMFFGEIKKANEVDWRKYAVMGEVKFVKGKLVQSPSLKPNFSVKPAGKSEIWVMPLLPFLLFMFFGLILYIFLGNLVWLVLG